MELRHKHGSVTVEGADVVDRRSGKNLVTRKEWSKEDRVPVSAIASILVSSRDRLTFEVEALDERGKVALHLEGCSSKPELDEFVRAFSIANPAAPVELAHPSHRLTDPAHEEAVKAAKRAAEFNAKEQKRREEAAGARPEVKVKVYDNHKDFAKDADKMSRDGWMPDAQITDRGKASVGGTVGKVVLTGGLGLITGMSRKSNKLTVTWMKQPKGFVPQEFQEVPEVPGPRRFSHESYFEARVLGPVPKGKEFEVPSPVESSPLVAPTDEVVEAPGAEQVNVESGSRQGGSVAEKLRELGTLRDEGLITADDFDTKKAEILSKL
jgi:putative oligomerization/nucleic acid binding protein